MAGKNSFLYTSLCAERNAYDELPLPNSPGPGTQSAREQLVRAPGRRPGRAHDQSVFRGPGRRPEHLHALVFDLVNHTSLQFLMIHISFQESFRKI